jgi:putative ABC transport system permease protein
VIGPIATALWRRKTGALLIATQIALTLAIVCNALVVVLDRQAQIAHPSGVDEAQLFHVTVLSPGYDDDPFGVQRGVEALLQGLPGVRAAAWVNQVPLSYSGTSTGVGPEEGQAVRLSSAHYSAGRSLVDVLGLRLVQGRDFLPQEVAELDLRHSRQPPTVVIVTQALARQLYPGQTQVVGRRMRMGQSADDPVLTIIGVVERLVTPWGRADWMEGDPFGERSFITAVRTNERETYLVRTDPGQRERVQREAVQRLQAAAPGRIVISNAGLPDTRSKRYRSATWLSGLLLLVTGLLLVMTAAGIVGLVSLWVAQRRKQIGVRRALGARRIDIVQHFLMENGIITGLGVVAGLTLAVGLNGVLVRSAGVPPLPWWLLLAAALVLPLLGALATLGPALRAARVNPAEATRSV